jgi:DNA damage-binding protein 1
MIGSIDEIQKLHIRTVPLGEMPFRISYIESAKAYCVITSQRPVDEAGEVQMLFYFSLELHSHGYIQ